MISEDTVLLTSRYHFVNQRIPKQNLSCMHWNVRLSLNFFCLHWISDWFKQSSNFMKSSQSSMYINPPFSKQLPFNKISSQSTLILWVTEILCEKQVKISCKLFLGIVCNSHDCWSKSYTERHPLKMVFHKLPFCRFMHNSLCENNTFLCEESDCTITKAIVSFVTRIINY